MPTWFDHYFVHVLSGPGYNFWSGIGSDIGELAIIGAVAMWWRNHNCHVHRCWRLSWHPHPKHGHPVCRHHHPDHKKIGVATAAPPPTEIRKPLAPAPDVETKRPAPRPRRPKGVKT